MWSLVPGMRTASATGEEASGARRRPGPTTRGDRAQHRGRGPAQGEGHGLDPPPESLGPGVAVVPAEELVASVTRQRHGDVARVRWASTAVGICEESAKGSS